MIFGKTAQKNSFYGFEVVSSAKRGWFHGFYIKFLMTILGGQYQVDWTIFKTGQFWGKNPENGVFPHFSAPGPPGNFFQFPKLFSMGFLAIPAEILRKRQKVNFSAFLADFQENGSRIAKNAPRNLWDVPNGQFQATFAPHDIKIFFLKSVPEI